MIEFRINIFNYVCIRDELKKNNNLCFHIYKTRITNSKYYGKQEFEQLYLVRLDKNNEWTCNKCLNNIRDNVSLVSQKCKFSFQNEQIENNFKKLFD